MSNQSYEKLHKLVKYLIKHKVMEVAEIARLLGIPLIEFISEFDDELHS